MLQREEQSFSDFMILRTKSPNHYYYYYYHHRHIIISTCCKPVSTSHFSLGHPQRISTHTDSWIYIYIYKVGQIDLLPNSLHLSMCACDMLCVEIFGSLPLAMAPAIVGKQLSAQSIGFSFYSLKL